MIGERYGYLVVTGEKVRANGKTRIPCRCDCGKETLQDAYKVKSGAIKSCGCYKRTRLGVANRTHGMSRGKSATYLIWKGMTKRCRPGHLDSGRYYDRGIRVCERWLAFESFLADMGERPAGMSIDRIDNDKGYEPGNCRWATPKDQARNTRRNRLLTFDGKTMSVSAWAEALGTKPYILSLRLRRGWSVEQTLTAPTRVWPDQTVTYNGKTMRVDEWAVELGWHPAVLKGRLKRGWPIDRAFNEPLNQHMVRPERQVSA